MRINKKTLLGSAALMVVLTPLVAQKAQAATATIGAQAIINKAITFTNTVSMDFGVLTETAAGSVTINFADTVANFGGGLNPAGGTPASGAVDIKATSGVNLVVSTTGGPNFMLKTGGGGSAAKSLTLNTLKYQLNGATAAGTLTKSMAAATSTLTIGGKLISSGGQNTGTYTGNFTVSVAYQ